MDGDLANTGLPDALRKLARTSASGTLTVRVDGEKGSVSFAEGRIVAARSPSPAARLGDRIVGAGYLDASELTRVLGEQARYPDTGRLGELLVSRGLVSADAVRLFVAEQVVDAVFELARLGVGGLDFEPGAVDPPTRAGPGVAVEQALDEVARRTREWESLLRAIPDLSSVPATSGGERGTGLRLASEERVVLDAIDGRSTLNELADRLGYGRFDTARIVYALVLEGAVTVLPPLPGSEPDRDLPPAVPASGPAPAPRPGTRVRDVDTAEVLRELGRIGRGAVEHPDPPRRRQPSPGPDDAPGDRGAREGRTGRRGSSRT